MYETPVEKCMNLLGYPELKTGFCLWLGQNILPGEIHPSPADQKSHITRKPAFGVCDLLRLKPACTATESS